MLNKVTFMACREWPRRDLSLEIKLVLLETSYIIMTWLSLLALGTEPVFSMKLIKAG